MHEQRRLARHEICICISAAVAALVPCLSAALSPFTLSPCYTHPRPTNTPHHTTSSSSSASGSTLCSASRAHFPLYFFDAVAPWISFPLRTSNRSLVSLPGLKIRVRIRIRNEPITETQHSPDFDCNSNTIYALSY